MLGEIGKTCAAADQAIGRFLALGLDPAETFQREQKFLLDLESGMLGASVLQASGHCHKIHDIHETYLCAWFDTVLGANSVERFALAEIFATLGSADSELFARLTRVVSELQKDAKVAVDLIAAGDPTAAQAQVLGSFNKFRPLRKILSETLTSIFALQVEFLEMGK